MVTHFAPDFIISMDNDGEILRKPEVYDVAISIEDIGLYDKYLGALYHFNKPHNMSQATA